MIHSAGDDRGGRNCGRQRVGDREPSHVGRHLLTVDLGHGQLRVRERRDRCRRADQHVGILEEVEKAAVDFTLLDIGPSDVSGGPFQAALGVVDDVRSQLVAMLLQPLAMRPDEVDAAQNLEHVVHRAEIGVAVLRVGEDLPECADPILEDAPDVVVDRGAAEICRDRHAHAAEIDRGKHVWNAQRIVAGERVVLIEIDLRLEQQVHILDAAAHGSVD